MYSNCRSFPKTPPSPINAQVARHSTLTYNRSDLNGIYSKKITVGHISTPSLDVRYISEGNFVENSEVLLTEENSNSAPNSFEGIPSRNILWGKYILGG